MLYWIVNVLVVNGQFWTRKRESSHDLEYLENYTDGVDPVHCMKGTCNLVN